MIRYWRQYRSLLLTTSQKSFLTKTADVKIYSVPLHRRLREVYEIVSFPWPPVFAAQERKCLARALFSGNNL